MNDNFALIFSFNAATAKSFLRQPPNASNKQGCKSFFSSCFTALSENHGMHHFEKKKICVSSANSEATWSIASSAKT